MATTLDEAQLDGATRRALGQFFECSSAYVIGHEGTPPEHHELAERWNDQCVLDETVAAIATGDGSEAMSLASRFVSRPAVFVGLMARMLRSGRAGLVAFVVNALEQDPHCERGSTAGGRFFITRRERVAWGW
jgi:hypothetical protein